MEDFLSFVKGNYPDLAVSAPDTYLPHDIVETGGSELLSDFINYAYMVDIPFDENEWAVLTEYMERLKINDGKRFLHYLVCVGLEILKEDDNVID